LKSGRLNHYGRICPVETPEGPNIGLITSLASYARVNDYGFIVSPYRKVSNGRVTDEIKYLDAIDGERHVIAQATSPLDPKGNLVGETVSVRVGGDFKLVTPAEVEYIDVSQQKSRLRLITELENDGANRALGSNMRGGCSLPDRYLGGQALKRSRQEIPE
jgi:DNA-directed RNA polymerase subunit beta